MATDIAFAMGVLALVGARAGSRLKLFLLTLAVADDIGAIVVIALFYSGGIEVEWVVGALGVIAVIAALRTLGAASPLWYVVPAVALWVCTHESGIHATIAGVVLGLLTPIRAGSRRPLESLERGLHPGSSFVVVPLFALANAGVYLGGGALERAASSAVAWGVVAGLLVGKTIGIGVATGVAARAGVGRLPEGVRPVEVWRVAVVAGIGFTVSLFIAGLAFEGSALAEAKIGILTASVVAGAVGTSLFLFTRRRSAPPPA
jgi:NhaA family Na+:H+ antiporter